jgi:hypothetical protein
MTNSSEFGVRSSEFGVRSEFWNSKFQSRRDCDLQPRVARNELPWVSVTSDIHNRNAVAACHHFNWCESRRNAVVDGV